MTSVVVICLDSVRKDYFDQHTSTLQRMSDFSMSECRAGSSWSVPSHASFLTGSLPSEHGIHTHNMDFSSVERDEVLTGRLEDHHATYVSANQFTTPEFGFDSWFDSGYPVTNGRYFHEGIDANGSSGIRDHVRRSLQSNHRMKSILNGALLKLNYMTSGRSVGGLLDDGCEPISKMALDIAEEQGDELFMFINMMEGHLPHRLFRGMDRNQFDLLASWTSTEFDHWEYNESEEDELGKFADDVEKFREFYAAAIDYLDRRVSTLIERLEDTLEDNVVAIVMADHGENLGGEYDRHLMEHTGALTEGLLHVPFEVINSPIEIDGSKSLFSLCELPDLVTAIVDGEDYTLGNHPVSVELLGEGLDLDSKESDYWNRGIRCTYDNGKKYEWDTVGNRYRVAINVDGPSTETILDRDVTIDNKLCARFAHDLQTYRTQVAGRSGQSEGISETTESRLSELGYL
ncbi:sulfatase-like hydrolase/transferase [Halorubrum ezzemoulense]|uniref:alkaline phosphatase family protein n=1 Tax=Halorubrum ezzemoulense TaxID=337243 RepID=UPI00232F1E7F|nr:alkaline phosphatase family protein [Halorubrum ezzemoulense]MDB9250754.1 sulfatase-like hydrolase/transferase [Halorubrum ezzemoulense]MDB9260879.1 sulfatase-like hydrolase/transferase [Halorubrum ezzemoulense]MDB9264287.1 sulfatase-like hydrolase/transferase [Halorubrum ezzemoulense]MDB9267779.1 sulfatase-like hydrolase/transferase [Halorubrum ezzemoulense]MDB9271240.1 sulfatase-like hydrolase/transferase [Halorubrum ezzemoulense]